MSLGGPWCIGENLPWTAPWTGEAMFGLAPSPIFAGLLELTQAEAQGEGEPQFVGMHLARQRRAILEHLCQVCGAPTARSDRFLFPAVTGTFLKVKGRTRYATHMPPVHAACAERAMSRCPHLRGKAATPTPFPRDDGFLSPETSLPETLAHLRSTIPASGVAFGYFRVFGEGFTRVAERARRSAPPSTIPARAGSAPGP